MLPYANNSNEPQAQQDIFAIIKIAVKERDSHTIAKLLEELTYDESLFECLLQYESLITNNYHLQLFIIAFAAKAKTNEQYIEIFLKQVRSIVWLMRILTMSKSGLTIFNTLIRYDRFYKLLELIVTNFDFFADLIRNTFLRKDFIFTETLLQLLETACVKSNNHNYLLYKTVLYCQTAINENQTEDSEYAQKNYAALLESLLRNYIGVPACEVLRLLNQKNYEAAFISAKSLSSPHHIISMTLTTIAPELEEKLKKDYFEQALRLCDQKQTNDHIGILVNFADYLLNKKENVSDIIKNIFVLAAQAIETEPESTILLDKFITNCEENFIDFYLLRHLYFIRIFLQLPSEDKEILLRKYGLVIINNLLALTNRSSFNLIAVTGCLNNDLIEIIRKNRIDHVRSTYLSINSLIFIPLTKIIELLIAQARYIEATVIADSVITVLKQLPINTNSLSFSLLLEWLILQYQCLVRYAQVNALQRSELLAQARAVRSKLSHYSDFILEKRLQDESLIGHPENIIKDIDFSIKLGHRDPAIAIFSLLYQFIRVDIHTLPSYQPHFKYNMHRLHFLCQVFFDDRSYRPEIKAKLLSQWRQLLKSLLTKFLNNYQAYSDPIFDIQPLILDLIIDIQQLILDLQVYEHELLSLRNIIRFFSPNIVDKSAFLSTTIEYLKQRNECLIPKNLISAEKIEVQLQQQRKKHAIFSVLIEKILQQVTKLDNEQEDIENISTSINQSLKLLQENLISEIIHIADEEVMQITYLAEKLSAYTFYNEALTLIKILWQLSFNFDFDVINRALVVWKNCLFYKLNHSPQLHEELLLIRKIRITACLLANSKYTESLDRVLMTREHLTYSSICGVVASSFNDLNIPYVPELYDALGNLFTTKATDISLVIINITGLLFNLEPGMILSKNIINQALSHTCQLLDVFLLQLIEKTVENEAFDLKLKLLDLLINLHIKLKHFDHNKFNEKDAVENIENFLHSLQSWSSPLTKTYYQELIATRQKLAELEKLELDTRKSDQQLSLISLLENLHRYYYRHFNYHYVAEITITLRDILVANASQTEPVCHVLGNLVHQFYYKSPLTITEKQLYLQRFEWLITNLFNLVINDFKINCDIILSLDTLLLDIKSYQEKIKEKMALESPVRNNVVLSTAAMQT